MAKLLIGSSHPCRHTVVNFKVIPAPERERQFLLTFESLAAAISP